VITSSTAAVTSVPSKPPIHTEAEWNEGAVNEVEEKGKDANEVQKYRASKTLAEQGEGSCVQYQKIQVGDAMLIIDSCVGFLQQEQGFHQLGLGHVTPAVGVRSEHPN
jgi:hypothetical protein